METSKKDKEIIPKEILYKFAILLVSVFCIVYVLPRDSKNNMQFEEGLPWGYGTQIAEFDFPIYKSDAVVQQEQDSIMAEFTPYCQLNDSVATKQLQIFRQKISTAAVSAHLQHDEFEGGYRGFAPGRVFEGVPFAGNFQRAIEVLYGVVPHRHQ